MESKKKHEFLLFEEARSIVRSLKLQGSKEWKFWTKSSDKPKNIPANPARTYQDKGWIDYGDWLGTDYIANGRRKYLPFAEARAYVHQLKIKNERQWRVWTQTPERPENITTVPSSTYKNEGWKNWPDWLGNGATPKNIEYLPFVQARFFVQKQGISTQEQYVTWAKSSERPQNIPANPRSVYKNDGWKGIGDWLGTGSIANQNCDYFPYEQARVFVHRLNLQNSKEYTQWAKTADKPPNIPASPLNAYKNKGWKGMGDWLGTDRVANQDRQYLSFYEARLIVQSKNIPNKNAYAEWVGTVDRPKSIPANPREVYKNDGWSGWGNWLGTGFVANQNKKFLSFEQARKYVHGLKFIRCEPWIA